MSTHALLLVFILNNNTQIQNIADIKFNTLTQCNDVANVIRVSSNNVIAQCIWVK